MKKFRFLLLCFVFVLCGCEANLEWYARNLTDQPVTVSLHYPTQKEKYRAPFIPLKRKTVNFKKDILKIDYETSDALSDSLSIQMIDSATYQLVIPARSTVELSRIIPTDYGRSEYNVVMEFEQGGKTTTVKSTDIFTKNNPFRATGKLTLKNLVYYDYAIAKK